MDKTLVASLSALGTTTVAVPATVLASSSSVSPTTPKKQEEVKYKWKGETIPLLNSSDVKTNYKNVECLKDFAGKDGKWGADKLKADPSGFLASIEKHSGRTGVSGCLMVEYYKQEKGGKWKGGFKLVWLTSNDTEGLVTVFNANTNNDEKLVLDSSIYFISKEGGSWSISYATENIGKEIPKGGDLANYFPQPRGDLGDTGAAANYWNFKPNVTKICKGNECPQLPEDTKATKKYTFKWNGYKEGTTGKPITEWSANFNSWFGGLFGNKWSKVTETLATLKGDWSKR